MSGIKYFLDTNFILGLLNLDKHLLSVFQTNRPEF